MAGWLVCLDWCKDPGSNHTFHPQWDGKISISYGLSNNNSGDGGCGWLLPTFGGFTAQVDWLGLRVGGQSTFIK